MTEHQPKIEKLITELCPNGLDFFSLSDISTVSGAGVDKKIKPSEKTIKLLNYMDVYRNRYLDKSIPTMEVTTNGHKIEQCNVLTGDVFFTPSSEVLNDIGNSAVAVEGMPGIVYSYHIMRIRLNKPNITTSMFVSFMLESDYVQNQINKNAKGITRFGLTKTQWEKIKIPLPPLAIQEEIVKILDSFTELKAELKAELEAELEARKKQYEYYRDEMLSFENEVEWETLRDVLKRTKGTPITAGQMNKINKDGAPIKIFAGGKTVAHVDYGDIPEKDVLTEKSIVVKSRGIIEFEYIDKPFSHKNEFWSYHSKNPNISIKYIYYYLKTKEKHFQKLASKMQMPQISLPDTEKLKVPIPSFDEQKRIVSILDKFDAIVNNVSIGLPAELKARRQQYEYYREKLLTFQELEK
jgi:type I restriction enzyme, S subunit